MARQAAIDGVQFDEDGTDEYAVDGVQITEDQDAAAPTENNPMLHPF